MKPVPTTFNQTNSTFENIGVEATFKLLKALLLNKSKNLNDSMTEFLLDYPSEENGSPRQQI